MVQSNKMPLFLWFLSNSCMVMIRIKDEYVCVMSITADVKDYSKKDHMCPACLTPGNRLGWKTVTNGNSASLIRKSGACQPSPSCSSARTYKRAQLAYAWQPLSYPSVILSLLVLPNNYTSCLMSRNSSSALMCVCICVCWWRRDTVRGDSKERQINLQSRRENYFIRFTCEAAGHAVS